MQFQSEVKQALIELPAPERVVAIALKNIYQRIKKLNESEKKQIDDKRNMFLEKFKKIQQNASSIVKGRKLQQSQLAKLNEYFVEEEKKDMKIALQSVTPMKDYWLVAIKNSFLQSSLNQDDDKILSNLINIESKITQNTIQLSFDFEQSGEISGGSYKRILQLDNGMPKSCKGDKLKLKRDIKQGFIIDLFTDASSQQQVFRRMQIITYFTNTLIPYSLRYYLGEAIEEQIQQEQEADEDQEDDEQQQEQNQLPNKKKN